MSRPRSWLVREQGYEPPFVSEGERITCTDLGLGVIVFSLLVARFWIAVSVWNSLWSSHLIRALCSCFLPLKSGLLDIFLMGKLGLLLVARLVCKSIV